MTKVTRRILLVGAMALAMTPAARAADPLKEIRIDWATYNPVSLVLKQKGLLEKEFAKDGITITWVQSAVVPDSESDESFPEVVEVRDPHHPLWGRSYRVIRKIGQRGRGIPASYEVEYRAGSSLLIQATAIEYYEQEANQIKLSMEALLELLSTADCPDAHEHGSSRSLVDADARAPTPDRRRRRRNFGGDPS
ncbi:hypothetical protein ABIF50_002651 [Bradyrhizobium diazoefficiens]